MDHNDTPTAPADLSALTDHGPVQAVVRSFGFGHAAPDQDGLMLDMRRFRNVPMDEGTRDTLVAGTGLDAHVRDYVLETPGVRAALEEVAEQAAALIAWATDHGQYIVIQIGCTGGRHRSVAGAEHVAAILRSLGITTEVEHRDVHLPLIRSGPTRAESIISVAGLAAMIVGLAGLVLAVADTALVGGWFPLMVVVFAIGYVWSGPHAPPYTGWGPWWPRLQALALIVGGAFALIGVLTATTGMNAALYGLAVWVAATTLPSVLPATIPAEKNR